MANAWGLNGTYTPEQAQAAIANARRNPLVGATFSTSIMGPDRSGLVNGVHVVLEKGRRITTSSGGGGGGGFGLSAEIPEQEQKPENPGIRKFAVSTYGVNIPISTGRRRVTGNIIWAGPIRPRRIGDRDYYVKVPLEVIDPACCEGSDVQGCERPNSDDPCNKLDGKCVDVHAEIKSCVNYDTGKYMEFNCTPFGLNGGWICGISATNVGFPGGIAFTSRAADGGVAQCEYCEKVGIFDNSQECIEGIQEIECAGGPS